MKRFLLILFAATLAWAQQDNRPTSAIIDVKYADPIRIQNVLSGIFRGNMRADSSLHAIAVSANSADDLAAITAAIPRSPAILRFLMLTILRRTRFSATSET